MPPRPGRETTASMRPYSTASWADMKKSRSVSMVMRSMSCPVNSACIQPRKQKKGTSDLCALGTLIHRLGLPSP